VAVAATYISLAGVLEAIVCALVALWAWLFQLLRDGNRFRGRRRFWDNQLWMQYYRAHRRVPQCFLVALRHRRPGELAALVTHAAKTNKYYAYWPRWNLFPAQHSFVHYGCSHLGG